MASYISYFGEFDTDTNVFNETLLASLLYYAPEGAQLSDDGKAMVYDFGGGGYLFTSDAGYDGAWNGKVNAIGYVENDTVLALGNGFDIDGTTLRDAIDAGDTARFNALAWSGNDVIVGGDSRDTLKGYDGRDTLLGGNGSDTLIGDAGNDRIVGGSGADDIFGGTGSDRLFGGAGADVIVGGAGNDVIGGGAGSDSVSGGAGADTFEFRSLGQIRGTDFDFITDFSHSQGDKIDVHFIDADPGTPGDQAFTFVDNTGDTLTDTPAAGSLVLETAKGDNAYAVSLYYDGLGNHLTFIVLAAEGAPTADDFVL